ncbi:MAG TPA: alpha/beta hydrolase [Candidatus Angelobacter sp.]|nr:alpha/beta hydrolase [Candidatus Angelobacter sp.]
MSGPQLPALGPVREPTGEGYLDREGVRLHWLEWAPSGTPEPPAILLLHGLSSNARYWERVARSMTNRRLVALDQRSHGLSDSPPTGYGLDLLAADAGHAIRELGLNRPIVVGHSWGGTVALEVGATPADLISGVAVMDGPIASMSERIKWEDASRMMQPPLPRYRSFEEAFEASRQVLGEAWGDDLQGFVEAGLRRDGDFWVLTLVAPVRLQILEQLYRFRPEVAMAAIDAPLLIGLAANDTAMRAWKEEGARRVHEIRPDADIRWYQSRHDIPLIRPDEVASDLEALARSVVSV